MSVDVFRRGTGKVWHYRFQVAGTRIMRSTRLTDKPTAQKVAERAKAAAVAAAAGVELAPTLDQLFAQWLEVRGPVVSSAHRKSVELARRLHLYDLADVPANQINTLHMQRTRNQHLQTHQRSSANQWLRVINLVVNWAVECELLARRPYKLKKLEVQKRPRTIMPLDVVMTWLGEVDKASKRSRNVAVAVRLMFGIGLRESEAATARWEWLDWERRTFTPGDTKGREADPVPLPDWLVEYLAPRRQPQGLIAPRSNGGMLSPGYARRAMAAANAACSTKGITPHRLRGSFATLLSERGASIQTIQAVMRHKSPVTTMAYLEKNLSTIATAQAKIAQESGLLRRKSGAQLESNPYET